MTYVALLQNDNDVIIKGSRPILNTTELYQAIILRDTTGIHISQEFADRYFTASGLADFIKQAKEINPFCESTVDAAVKDFQTEAVRELARYNDPGDVIYQLMSHPKEMMGVIHTLCDSYMHAYSETLVANNKVATLQLQNSELMKRLDDASDELKQVLMDKELVQSQLGMLVGRINYSFEKDVDPSQFIQIEGKSKYTKILYIKERVRVRYVDTLIYYLKEILRILYGVPAREVVIGPYYSYEGAQMYPHLVPSFGISYTNLYKADIYMPGFQPRIMEDILRNPSNVEYRIVLDRCGMGVPHIIGDGVEYIYTMSDPRDNYDDLPQSRIISYFHDTLHIPFIEDFDKLSLEERMNKYSSMLIMKFLIELLERR